MTNAIELQIISRILTSNNPSEIDRLCAYDDSYYAVFKDQINFILKHREKYGEIPDLFTFQAEFNNVTIIDVNEPLNFLEDELKKNKQHILFLETFNKLADLNNADVTDAWEYLSQQCEKAAQLDASNPMDIIKDAEKRADQIIEFNQQNRIPTGFPEVDKLMYGGLSTVEELLVIIARTNTGKAQPLWSKVLTPQGWKTMGKVKVGDILVGKNNDNGKVVQIFPQGVKDYYRVYFNDGTYAECCDDHLWEVVSLSSRKSGINKYEVLRLSDIRQSDETYTIDLCGRIQFDDDSLNSELDRIVSSAINSPHLVNGYTLDDILEAVRSYGFFAYRNRDKIAVEEDCSYKTITKVEYAGRTECQCILVDNYSHTYITDSYTVTHNTWVTTKIMESAQKNGFPVLYYSPEMRASFIGTRFDTWRGHFKNSEIFRGQYSEEYKEYIKNLTKDDASAFVVEDSDISGGRMTVRVLENLVKKHHIKLLVIDGLSYIADTSATDNNSSLKYKNICNDLFRLSKTYQCAVVCSVQANRETKENKDDKGEPFPTMFNAAESDHPARIATQVFALRQLFDSNTLEIRLEKSRIAKNTKPVLSYVWDPNTGSTEFVADNKPDSPVTPSSPTVSVPQVTTKIVQRGPTELIDDDDDDDEDIEF